MGGFCWNESVCVCLFVECVVLIKHKVCTQLTGFKYAAWCQRPQTLACGNWLVLLRNQLIGSGHPGAAAVDQSQLRLLASKLAQPKKDIVVGEQTDKQGS